MVNELNLRLIRDAKNLSTRTVADRIGVSQSTYLGWEHGRSSPSLKMLNALAEAIEVCPISFVAYLGGHITIRELLDFSKNVFNIKEAVLLYQRQKDGIVIENFDSLKEAIVNLTCTINNQLNSSSL
ncbi:helix-turn-helix domain-containing protein [Dyadobacter crusticola]|uniref:helix-turn-helix domain-containing protein n=1 Tax=Dyadobacter crusticola TaxID=292407 RepID=UPI0004E26550|nr:helix-turn-helix transcriptional regulator [Dyadobacter crusticola]